LEAVTVLLLRLLLAWYDVSKCAVDDKLGRKMDDINRSAALVGGVLTAVVSFLLVC
jgi:hypothetical protein